MVNLRSLSRGLLQARATRWLKGLARPRFPKLGVTAASSATRRDDKWIQVARDLRCGSLIASSKPFFPMCMRFVPSEGGLACLEVLQVNGVTAEYYAMQWSVAKSCATTCLDMSRPGS